MTTPQPKDLLGEIYQQWLAEMVRYPDMSIGLLRIIFDDWQRATTEPEDVTYAEQSVGGVPGLMVVPREAHERQVLLFLHGGGFALGSSRSHRKLAGHVARPSEHRSSSLTSASRPSTPTRRPWTMPWRPSAASAPTAGPPRTSPRSGTAPAPTLRSL